jgi:hypothetical protein
VYSVSRTLLLRAAAAVATILWSVAARRRTHHRTALAWLRLYTRVILGWFMLDYGSWKVVFPGQMREPALSTLLVPFGDLSPIARLWLLMGSSRFYTICSGVVEMLGGILLFIPRLDAIGALISAIALANVFLLDLSYDVPVRQFALLLLLMSVFLLAPDLPRILDLLVWNRGVQSRPPNPLFRRRRLELALAALVMLAGFCWFASDVLRERRNSRELSAKLSNLPYYGCWAVDQFALDGVERPALFTDSLRWKMIVFDWAAYEPAPSMVIHSGTGARRLLSAQLDSSRKSVTLRRYVPEGSVPGGNRQPIPAIGILTVDDTAPGRLILDGDLDGRKIHAVLLRVTPGPAIRKWPRRWFQSGPFWGDDIVI